MIWSTTWRFCVYALSPSFSYCLKSFSTVLWSFFSRTIASGMAVPPGSAKRGEQLVLREGEEAVLVGADLVEVDVVEAGVGVRLHGVEDGLWVGAARHVLDDLLLAERRRRRLEVRR